MPLIRSFPFVRENAISTKGYRFCYGGQLMITPNFYFLLPTPGGTKDVSRPLERSPIRTELKFLIETLAHRNQIPLRCCQQLILFEVMLCIMVPVFQRN